MTVSNQGQDLGICIRKVCQQEKSDQLDRRPFENQEEGLSKIKKD